MAEPWFLDQLEDLTGKVAIVTGGAAGIGLESTIYLAAKGCTVYVASRNEEKCKTGIQTAESRLNGKEIKIHFHQLDLSSAATSIESAKSFLTKEERLDIIIANAGVSMVSQAELSPDGWEKTIATNHFGHAAFILELLDLVKSTANTYGEARIVNVASDATRLAPQIDWEALQKPIPNDGQKIKDLKGSFQRYGISKVANVYFTKMLDKKLQESGDTKIYVNTCHPGMSADTGLGSGQMNPLPSGLEAVLRFVLRLRIVGGNSLADSGKTQTYLAAAKDIPERNIHGEFWTPQWSLLKSWKGCGKGNWPAIVDDEVGQKRLWEETEKVIAAAKKGESDQ